MLLNCFIYDNPGNKVPEKHKYSDYVKSIAQTCIKQGIEIWQGLIGENQVEMLPSQDRPLIGQCRQSKKKEK